MPLHACWKVLAIIRILVIFVAGVISASTARIHDSANSSGNGVLIPQSLGDLWFSVPEASPIAMGITDSVRYQLGTAEGQQDFAKLLPSGGHLVYIGEPHVDAQGESEIHPEPYTVTLFHQFKCLDIVRDQLRRPEDTVSALTKHCMNYLRQTILCRPNLRLEAAKNGVGVASRTYDAVCRDWRTVYEEADRNQKALTAWMTEHDLSE